MSGTIISLLLALFIFLYRIESSSVHFELIPYFMIIIGTLFFFSLLYIYSRSWTSLQRSEQDSSSRVLDLFLVDAHFHYVNIWIILFAFLSYLASMELLSYHFFSPWKVFAVWIFLFGISIDVLYHSVRRIAKYLSPFHTIEMFTNEARECIRDERELDLTKWIDAISEMGIKSAVNTMPSLAIQSVDELQLVAKNFLESSKSISHHEQDTQTREMGITDKVGFILHYILQRIELINEKAIQANLEPVCSGVITGLSKIVLSAAKYDMTITAFPLHVFGKCTKRCQDSGFEQIGIKASVALVEISREILNEIDVTYLEIKDTFLLIVNLMEKIAQDTFRKNRGINIQVLIQPVKDLRGLFTTEKMAAQPDTPVILAAIDGLIEQFNALETVLNKMPPVQEIAQGAVRDVIDEASAAIFVETEETQEQQPKEPPPGRAG